MKLSDAIEKLGEHEAIKTRGQSASRTHTDLRSFCVFLRNKHIEQIQVDEIIAFFHILKETGIGQNNIYQKAMAIRKLFRFLSRRGCLCLNYESIPIPAREFNQPRCLTEREYHKLISAIDRLNEGHLKFIHIRNKAIIGLLWDTGARNGEIMSLNVSDLDLEKRQAIIKTEKSRGKRPFRTIFWTERTNQSLKTYLEARQAWSEKMIFQEPDALWIGNSPQLRGKRLTNHALDIVLRKYSLLAGIPTANPHSFRHHMGHQIIHKGGSNADVMNILGHSDLNSSHQYTWMNGDETKERWKKIVE